MSVLEIKTKENGDIIHMTSIAMRSHEIFHGYAINIGSTITSSSYVIHNLVPVAILYTIVSVWPTQNQYERGMLLLLSLPVTIILVSIAASFLLVGKLSIMFQQMAEQAGQSFDNYYYLFLSSWVVIMETGGLWMLGIAGALICVIINNRLFSVIYGILSRRTKTLAVS